MNKAFKLFEIIWLLIGCICLLTGIYSVIIGENQSALYFLIFTIISASMYYLRRRQNKNNADSNNPKDQKK